MATDSTKTKRPGQDTMFWKPGDIYDVECARCGNELEFFKDEASRRCPKCGNKVSNPKFTLGCAQWCEHAEECLGYDPKKQGEGAESGETLVQEAIEAMRREFAGDDKRIDHALAVLSHAEDIMKAEGGDPKVVLTASILHDIGIKEAEKKHGSAAPKYQELEGPAIAKRILREIGLPEAAVSDVVEIVGAHHSARCRDTVEFRTVWDADHLVNLPEEHPELEGEKLERFIEKTFRTETGKQKARKLFT